MNPIELIKKILQALDQQEQEKDLPNANRMKQIDDVNQKTITQYSNSPDERYSTVDKVTTKAGGGANYPKHPADIRGEHPSQYPETRKTFRDYYADVVSQRQTSHDAMIDQMNTMNKETE
jgi:hypothetical protein